MFGFVSEMQRTPDVFRERFGGQRLLGGEIAARIVTKFRSFAYYALDLQMVSRKVLAYSLFDLFLPIFSKISSAASSIPIISLRACFVARSSSSSLS